MPLSRTLRTNHRGALELAKAGVRKVDDLWDAAKRQWRPAAEVLAAVPYQQRHRADAALTTVYAEVARWVGDDMGVLTEPPRPPQPGTWWWDEGRMCGGQVVESQPCVHADRCFGGFDLVIAPQPRYEWTPLTAEEQEEGKLPPARLTVCGYDGAPVVTHGPVKPGQRGTLAGVATHEGLRSDRWSGATERRPIPTVATSKQFRSALRFSKRKTHAAPTELALQRWRRWAPGTLADNLLRALRQARRLPGLKAKIQQLCIKLMWG